MVKPPAPRGDGARTAVPIYGQALQAAVDGFGVRWAFGPTSTTTRRRTAGRAFALTVPKGMRWYLVYRSFQTERAISPRPALDHPRRGRTAGRKARRQDSPPCRLSKFPPPGAKNRPDV